MSDKNKIVAIIGVRNEEASLPHALRRLVREGISFAVIDNGSSDRTRDIILDAEFEPWLLSLIDMPFLGHFNLDQQLSYKIDLINSISCDWVIHLDADEVMQSNVAGETLREAIKRIDHAGYNVVNFEEFVFLPIDYDFDSDTHDYQKMQFYYFFAPIPQRLMRAWKRSAALDNRSSGGHMLSGANMRVCPENLILRHYIFRSQSHALEKYAQRQFANAELERGWHGNRFNQPPRKFLFPSTELMERLAEPNSIGFSRDRPHKQHFWQW